MKKMKMTVNPYTTNYGHQYCWNEGYRQALLDMADHIMQCENKDPYRFMIDITMGVADAIIDSDPRKPYVGGTSD